MASFTSAVPGAPGSPDMATAKVHPMPLSPGEDDDDDVPKALAFEDDADLETSKPAVAEEGGGGGENVEGGDFKREKRQTFDPDSEFFRNWDIFTTVLLIFTAVVTPVEARGASTHLTAKAAFTRLVRLVSQASHDPMCRCPYRARAHTACLKKKKKEKKPYYY